MSLKSFNKSLIVVSMINMFTFYVDERVSRQIWSNTCIGNNESHVKNII